MISTLAYRPGPVLGLWSKGQTRYSGMARERRWDPNAEDTDTAKGMWSAEESPVRPTGDRNKGTVILDRLNSRSLINN